MSFFKTLIQTLFFPFLLYLQYVFQLLPRTFLIYNYTITLSKLLREEQVKSLEDVSIFSGHNEHLLREEKVVSSEDVPIFMSSLYSGNFLISLLLTVKENDWLAENFLKTFNILNHLISFPNKT